MGEHTDGYKGQAHEAGQRLSAASHDLAAEAKVKAHELGEVAKERAYDEVEARKGGVAQELRKLGEALDSSAQQVGSEGESLLSRPLAEVARFCKDASTSLSERGPRQLFSDVEELGRRQPALFFGMAMAAGFLATRLLRSDSESAEPHQALPSASTWPQDIQTDVQSSERGH